MGGGIVTGSAIGLPMAPAIGLPYGTASCGRNATYERIARKSTDARYSSDDHTASVSDTRTPVDKRVSRPVEELELARVHKVLTAQQAWNEVVWEAYQARVRAGFFASWSDGHEWLAAQVKLPPAPGAQLQWAMDEARITKAFVRQASIATPGRQPKRRRPKFTERQLEIAIAALAKGDAANREEVA